MKRRGPMSPGAAGRALKLTTGLAFAAAAALATVSARAGEGPGGALRDSTWLLDWRLRQEVVEQGGFSNDADAVTSRLRAGFQTAPLGATRLLVEGVGISTIRGGYDSTTNGNTAFPVVADPSFVAVNRFALTNTSLENTTWTIGRQRIIHDDARFIGNVGWRQNEQTFDAVRMQHAGASIEAELTYANQVNRIFGPDSAAGRWTGDVVMARLAHPFTAGKLAAFHYLFEIDEVPALSTRTSGARFSGSRAASGAIDVSYTVAVARQADAGANAADFTETYYLVQAGVERARLETALGYERLGGNGTSAVTTPLATLHAFQGWADRFLATPAAGLEDVFVKVGYRFGPAGPFRSLALTAVRHAFRSDTGSLDLGEETDFAFVARTGQLALTLKYASFDAINALADTDKAWLSLDYAW